MTLISAIKTYMLTYSELKSDAPLWVNYLGEDPTQYAIIPVAGQQIEETYINGRSKRVFPFLFTSMERTADDLARMENVGFFEDLSAWFEAQTKAGTFPTLESGKTAEKIEALNWGYLYQQGVSDTGSYQINCRLVYMQDL
jgi:hypothetical protein